MGTYCSVFGCDRRGRQPEFTVNAGFVSFLLTQVFQAAEPASYAQKKPSPSSHPTLFPPPPTLTVQLGHFHTYAPTGKRTVH